ncbi:hypothetical protein [Acetobacter tropicalis]|uniref:DUF2946 domain-containing protein n=1 Tax=Acetobacter tropicalis TaxID=104102 RepID=A0A252ABV9_9PROT|nr:hypothetical protein [Acetobacter tropicalis]OUI87043.1 hypothetical protein HC62_01115 [Acetobacter tropicalis]
MFRHTHPLQTLLKWPLVVVTLVGFLGLLALQSFAQPDELPRATIARLLGVDIAARMTMPDEDMDAASSGTALSGTAQSSSALHAGGEFSASHSPKARSSGGDAAWEPSSQASSPPTAVHRPALRSTNQHHHMMAAQARQMASAMANKATQPHSGHHHHGAEGCPLCPLLSLPAALPIAVLLVPPPVLRWMRRGSHASTPRAPPSVPLGLPPSRGPPA